MLELRDNINQALAETYVPTVSIKGDIVTLTTMESTGATMLNSQVLGIAGMVTITPN